MSRIPKLTREQLIRALKRVSGGSDYLPEELRTVAKQAWKMLGQDGRVSPEIQEPTTDTATRYEPIEVASSARHPSTF